MKTLNRILILISAISIAACSSSTKNTKPNTDVTQPTASETISLKSISLADLKMKKVNLSRGIVFQVPEYLEATDFRNDQQWQSMFSDEFRSQYLTQKPLYQERYEEGGDRLVVTRTLTLNFKEPCQTEPEEKFMSFCFKAKQGEINVGIKKGLKLIRHKITKAIDEGEVDTTAWKPLLTMSDADMLEFLLNKQTLEKKIIRKSVIPYVAYQMKGLRHQKVQNLLPLSEQGVLVPKSIDIENGLIRRLSNSSRLPEEIVANNGLRRVTIPIGTDVISLAGNRSTNDASGDPLTFSTESEFEKNYLMGDTFGRSFGDTYEVQFARETYFTDRYYASFTYDITYGFGLRFPFVVKGESTIDKVYSGQSSQVTDYPATELCAEVESIDHASRCARRAQVNIRAVTLDADEAFYEDVGVPDGQVFEGNEFVLELGATCALRASIPGPNLGPYRCPNSLSRLVDESRDFRSQLGTRPEDLAELLLPGREMGLAFEAGIGYAAINPGAVLQADDGVLSLDIDPFSSITSARRIDFDGGSHDFVIRENVTPGNAQPWGYFIDNPAYRMNAVLVPRVEVEVGVDVGVYDWKTTFGPYDLDSLAIDFGRYSFDAHTGVQEREQVTIAIRDNLEEGATDESVYFVAGTNCRDGEIILKNTLCELETVLVTPEQCASASFGERVRMENGNVTNLGFPESLRGKVDILNCTDGQVTVSLDYCSACTLTFEGNSCQSLSVSSGDKINFTGDIQWDDQRSEDRLRCISENTQVSTLQ